ncbi:hypothetical protein [Actinomyces succiniciruminis]|uniref:Uncharacterized protein n=1 Tax=Actinomyces succiniciruminis TaxID=1522002 RepID=A0A1L7RJS7_9ACTO|nr:hypothetical protein [Actinomyces succiniciruminis]CED90250.1 Hypothetical protein AAM4_0355 [Actinomyces succiniciruminis]
MLDLIDGADQLTLATIAGLLWPLVQAVMDRVEWTANRRRLVAIAAAVVISLVAWWMGSYPLQADMIATQAAVALGYTQASFAVLKRLGVLDWAGAVTPGGESRETYEARHRAGYGDEG